MKPYRIIQVSAYYPPHLGGQENAVHDLAVQLAAAGHDTHVVTSNQGGGARSATESGVHVHRLPGFVFGHAPIMPGFVAKLRRLASPGSIVHVHIGQAFTPEMTQLAARLCGFKYIAQLHIDFEPSGPAGILLPLYKKLLLGPALRSASAVIVLNQKTLVTVREKYGYTGDIRIMNNGIDEVYFQLSRPALRPNPPKVLRLLFVGRLSKQKNVPVLLNALRATTRPVHLDLVGDGDERDAITQLIAELGLSNVTFHGRLSRDKVMEFYKTCDALVMPSLYEAQPLVLLEAMATGIPIIGTNVIGVAEHLAGVGIIVEPTVEGLMNGFEHYFDKYKALPKMTSRGRQKAEKLRWKHTLHEYERLYETVLAD